MCTEELTEVKWIKIKTKYEHENWYFLKLTQDIYKILTISGLFYIFKQKYLQFDNMRMTKEFKILNFSFYFSNNI